MTVIEFVRSAWNAVTRWRVSACLAFVVWTAPGRLGSLLLEQAGTIGDVKLQYAASSNLTVTNLNSMASSSTFLGGWESAAVDNTTNKYTDYRITAKITVASSSLSAGEIRMYLVGMLDDSTWPDVFDGTESAETVTDSEMRDSICMRAAATATDTTNSDVYYLDCPSAAAVFGGNLPAKFVIFITQNTGQALASSGNQVTVKGSYANVAAS
jgi:hypothetical protein